jgi:hypothetical protein
MNTETKVIKTKLGLLNLAEQLGNVYNWLFGLHECDRSLL